MQGSVKTSGQLSSRASSMARAYSALSCETRSASILVLHVPPVGLPEPAHRGLGGARLLRLGALAAHVDHGQLVARRRDSALHEAAHAAVLHRDVAGGPDQVRLLHAAALHEAVEPGRARR